MYILKQNEFNEYDLTQVESFIQFWNMFYNYKITVENTNQEIDYFTELNLENDLTESNLKNLLRWKDPKYLSEIIMSGTNKGEQNPRVVKVLSKINKINDFRKNILTEAEFDIILNDCFPSGNGIWNIFLKHVAKPFSFPIYDQHVYRSFCWHKGADKKAINHNYNAYKQYFFEIYNSHYNTVDSQEKIKNMKKIDNALMSFGQFLKEYGNLPTTSST